MLPKENLYFIAFIPSLTICADITGFKQDFADRFSCRAALKLTPHITLKAPFKLPPQEHSTLLKWFNGLLLPIHPFHLEIRDFGVFPKKSSPVVFVKVMMNEHLQTLQEAIINSFKKSWPQVHVGEYEMEFKPHITIAYRDLDPVMFVEAWKKYSIKKYSAVADVKDFHLLQHDEKKWNIIGTSVLPEQKKLR